MKLNNKGKWLLGILFSIAVILAAMDCNSTTLFVITKIISISILLMCTLLLRYI